MSPTVPWVPWLDEDEHIPGEVVWLMYMALVIACEHLRRGSLVTGSGLVETLSRRCGINEDDAEFYVHMSMELGLVGGIEITTGHQVTVEHVKAAADPRAN